MRPPRTPFRPKPTVAPKGKVEGASVLVLAVAAAALVIGVGFLRAPRGLDPARAPLDRAVSVNLNPQDQARLDDWSEFFACHGLVNSSNVMLATVRANHGVWGPGQPIKLDLAPPADLPPATAQELAVLERVTDLTRAPESERDRTCSADAAAPNGANGGRGAVEAVAE